MGLQEERVWDEVQIHLRSFSYRLRIAQALMEEHNRTVLQSQATLYTLRLVEDLMEAAEHAQTFILTGTWLETEASVGEDS